MKKITLLTSVVTLLTTFSCSKDENCSFSKSTFENKTYKNSIVKVDSSGVDLTSRYAALYSIEPCSNNTITLNSDGTYKVNIASNCNSSSISGIWSVKTENGKNFIVADGQTTEISAFDCNSITSTSKDGAFTFITKMTKI